MTPNSPITRFPASNCALLASILCLAMLAPATARAANDTDGTLVSSIVPELVPTTWDPAVCEVHPSDALNGLVLSPNSPSPIPASVNTIIVRNHSNQPVVGASVVVTLTSQNEVCATTTLTGTTDQDGMVVITLGGGGCSHETPLSGLVKANGVTIRAYDNVKSPDFDGAQGDLLVNLADLIPFTNEFLDTAPSECHDYDNTGDTDLADLIIMSTPFSHSNSCAP